MRILSRCDIAIGEFGARDVAGIGDFFKICSHLARPAVWVEIRSDRADLLWDLAGLPPDFDPHLRPRAEWVFQEQVLGAYSVVTTRKSKYQISFFFGAIRKLPIVEARRLAVLVYSLLSKEVGRAKRIVQGVSIPS